MEENSKKVHTSQDVYMRLNSSDQQIAELRTTLAAFIESANRRFEEIASTVRRGLDDIKGEISHDRDRQDRPFPWVGVGILMVAVLVAGGSIISARFSPIEERQALYRGELSSLIERNITVAHEDGYLQGSLDQLKESYDLNFEIMGLAMSNKNELIRQFSERIAALEAQEAKNDRALNE